MIICAAIKCVMNNEDKTSLVIGGRRHSDCLATVTQLSDPWRDCLKIQGFITDKGDFLDRFHAYLEVIHCGQLSQTTKWYKQDKCDTELYSEDLY